MNNNGKKYTMIYLLKEWAYQKRWLCCFILNAVFFPFGLAATIPVALYDLKNRFEYSRNGIMKGIAAFAVASVELIAAFIMILKDGDTLIITVLLILFVINIGWGIFAIAFCVKINSRNAFFDYLENIIEVHHITSVSKIIKITGKSESYVLKMLNDMIYRERLEDAAISGNLKEVIVFRKWYKQSFLCKNCGGEYSINIGDEVVCPYCGSPSDENYLGDVSDNVKKRQTAGVIASSIHKHSLLFFRVGTIIQILLFASWFVFFGIDNYLILIVLPLLAIAGILMVISSVIYGDEEIFEKRFEFLRRHRFFNTFLQIVTWLIAFLFVSTGSTLSLYTLMEIGFENALNSILIVIFGLIEMIVGFFAIVFIPVMNKKEKEYW